MDSPTNAMSEETSSNGHVDTLDNDMSSPTKWFKIRNCVDSGDAGQQVTIDVEPGCSQYEKYGVLKVVIPSQLEKYKLRPKHFGPKVIFLDPEDLAMYQLELAKPMCVVWCLAKDENFDGYVKKRLWEASYARNVAFKIVSTSKFELIATKEGLCDVIYGGQKVKSPDVVLVRTGAVAADYFGLAVIRQLEKMGVTVLNDTSSIEISRDKLQTMQVMAAHGLPIAKTLLAKFPINLNVVNENFDYPIVVKKSSGSQGKGVILVDSNDQLEDIGDMLDQKEPIIFQEFLKNSKGRDLRVYVIGGRIVASMQRSAAKGFKANVHQGGNVLAYEISPSIEWLVLEAVRLTGLDVAGVDLLFDVDTMKICEINSSPGFEGLERATGVDVASATVSYIKIRTGVWRIPRRRDAESKTASFLQNED